MSHVYLNDLEFLEDILNSIVFEDEPSIFTEEHAVELVQTALHLMDEYIISNPNAISEPTFHDDLLEDIKEIFYIQMEQHIEELENGDDIEDDMNELLEDALNIFITSFYPERSIVNNSVNIEFDDNTICKIDQQIHILRNIPQPVQRTPEWYKFRWNLITASNAWKAFESQSAINQLIYEKCQPLKTNDEDEEVKLVNTNSPMHHGQKYEPLTVMIYERDYNTKVEDFGCIQHSTYKFLGASPDGIIVNKESERYGRMLEIKNVVSREITGIPKKEYWVQMQLQMEVCDLDQCDFLETKFVEYPDRNSYNEDFNYDENYDEYTSNMTITANGKQKGIIIQFHKNDGTPFYVYKPLNIVTQQSIMDWEEDLISLYQSEKYNYTFLKFIYWRLEQLSCVLVLRNREWFKNNIGQLEKVWKIIEEERVTGYKHRAPVKKQKKDVQKPFVEIESKGCFLFNKIIKIDTEII